MAAHHVMSFGGHVNASIGSARAARLLGAALLVAVCCFPHDARAANRFVSTGGNDAANDCQTAATPCATIQHAIGQATSGDTIAVSEGKYVESLTVTTSASFTI